MDILFKAFKNRYFFINLNALYLNEHKYSIMYIKITILLIGFYTLSLLSHGGETNAQEGIKSQESQKIRIASCQFPVSADINENFRWIRKQIIEAKLKKADIVHFPECALSGYPGSDMKTLENFKWDDLFRDTDSIMALAKELEIWVILGSMHRLSGDNKPHNT